MMHCYPCRFNFPSTANQLLDYAELVTRERKGIRLNLLAKSCAHNGVSKDFMKDETKETEERNNEDDVDHNKGNDASTE